MIEKKFEYPVFTQIGSKRVHVANGYCRVTTDRDEAAGLAEWYVAEIEIDATPSERTTRWFSLPRDSDEFKRLEALVLTEWAGPFNEAWGEWLADQPRVTRRQLETL